MCIALLFIITKTWKKPGYHSVCQLINILLCIHKEILFSAKMYLSRHEKTWRDLKSILLSIRSQSEKVAYCMTPVIAGKDKTMETVKISVIARSLWGRRDK